MDKNFRISLTTLAAALIILLVGPGNPASAQYVISARGGLVNYTTGPVNYSTSSDPTWKDVPTHLQLKEGDRIKTQDWGKAELLLNPGSYLRIGNGAEVVMSSTDLGAMAFELLSGSAILEVGNLPDEGVLMVQTPVTRVRIKKDGLYRIDVASDAITLTVRQGEAYFSRADGSQEKVKKNKTALITANDHQLAKFDSDQMDDFDLWSADRAELLLAANQSFIQRMGSWNWPNLRWSAWIFDPFYGCYTFFPWGSGFWSVYGYGYYYPWYGGYPGGYWSGGYIPGGQSGSGRPGGNPPTRATKPSFSAGVGQIKERGISFGERTGGSLDRPSGGFPRQGSGGSFGGFGGGKASGGYSSGASIGGHSGGGAKGGGASGGYHGGGSSGSAGVKSSGGNPK